jgi:hypothetical protein
MSSPTTTPQINVDVAESNTNIADAEQTLASAKAEIDAEVNVCEEIADAERNLLATLLAKGEAETALKESSEENRKAAEDEANLAIAIMDKLSMPKTDVATAISAQETKPVQLESVLGYPGDTLVQERKQDTMTPATKPAQLSVDVLRILSSPAVERFHLASSVLEDNYSTLRREYQEECQYGERMKLLQTALDSDNVNDITILFDNAKMRRESTIELGKRMQDINDYLRKVATANDELEKKLTNQTTFNPDAVALANEAANIFITALNMSKKIEAEYEVIKALIQNRKAGVRTPSPPSCKTKK